MFFEIQILPELSVLLAVFTSTKADMFPPVCWLVGWFAYLFLFLSARLHKNNKTDKTEAKEEASQIWCKSRSGGRSRNNFTFLNIERMGVFFIYIFIYFSHNCCLAYCEAICNCVLKRDKRYSLSLLISLLFSTRRWILATAESIVCGWYKGF